MFLAEEDEHAAGDETHQADDHPESEGTPDERHPAFDAHTEDGGEEREREGEDRDDGQGLHDIGGRSGNFCGGIRSRSCRHC